MRIEEYLQGDLHDDEQVDPFMVVSEAPIVLVTLSIITLDVEDGECFTQHHGLVDFLQQHGVQDIIMFIIVILLLS